LDLSSKVSSTPDTEETVDLTSHDSLLINAIRVLSAIFGLAACGYSVAFLIRYRHVDWKASAWGRHIYRFCRLIAVVMFSWAVLRLARIAGWDLEHPLFTALYGLVVAGWVAYEMRVRFNLEAETNAEKARRQEEYDANH
jgi:hypothetical protein